MTYKSKSNLTQGQIANIKIRNKNSIGVVIDEVEEPIFRCEEALGEDSYFNATQIGLAKFISNYYCSNLGIAYSLFVPLSGKSDTSPLNIDSINIQNILSPKQNLALSFIQNHQKTLLFGDTGSGKTEIYINIILETIKSGKNVIFLMPEISLTPQMENRLRNIFGDLVCIWHSKISKAKKAKYLQHINDFKIIAGARSALFLPIENIGLIIVDEEHDDAYKSNSNPKYNARDLSIYLSMKNNIKLVLGSATPSVVSYYNFNKNNEIFRLKGRHFDSKKSVIFEDSITQITPNLINKIKTTLDKKKQIIIFVPIRANFKTLLCKNCGKSIKCKNCSISMSFHSKQNALVCHYCGYMSAIVKNCPYCNSADFSALNIGTQEIAKELNEIFLDAKIAVFDRDEIKTDKKLKTTLNEFNNQKIDILVGTQMLSKGHDYHNVYLSVILGIDNLLNSNDFRAIEKSISLFYQIAGRCARKDDGEVFVQTLNKHFFQNFINDYEDFLKFELQNRIDFYPPYRKLALISSGHKNDKIALEIIESCKKIVESHKNIEIVGLNRAPIERINGIWRYFMLLRSKSPKELLECVHFLKDKQVSIDIDPLQLL